MKAALRELQEWTALFCCGAAAVGMFFNHFPQVIALLLFAIYFQLAAKTEKFARTNTRQQTEQTETSHS